MRILIWNVSQLDWEGAVGSIPDRKWSIYTWKVFSFSFPSSQLAMGWVHHFQQFIIINSCIVYGVNESDIFELDAIFDGASKRILNEINRISMWKLFWKGKLSEFSMLFILTMSRCAKRTKGGWNEFNFTHWAFVTLQFIFRFDV